MVTAIRNSGFRGIICCTALFLAAAHDCNAADSGYIVRSVSADACDDRAAGDDEHTAENRAVDKASLSAVKLSGVIQQAYPDLSADAVDTVAYRIIDEYMVNTAHAVKYSDNSRICVKLTADIELTKEDLSGLVKEYRDSDPPAEQIAAVAQKAKEQTSFKPQDLSEKKLLYIRKMTFWNGSETAHYADLLAGLLSGSEYFYVTDDESTADYILTPRLTKSEVNRMDANNNKMNMSVELEVTSPTDGDFAPLDERQEHSILFSSGKDEQKIADGFLRRLLTAAATEVSRKIDDYSARELEKNKAG